MAVFRTVAVLAVWLAAIPAPLPRLMVASRERGLSPGRPTNLDTNIVMALEDDASAQDIGGEKASSVYRVIQEAGGGAQIIESWFDDFARIAEKRFKPR